MGEETPEKSEKQGGITKKSSDEKGIKNKNI
jgi:hypothetical protein